MKQAFLAAALLLLAVFKLEAQKDLYQRPDRAKAIPFGKQLPLPQSMSVQKKEKYGKVYPAYDSRKGATTVTMPGRVIETSKVARVGNKKSNPSQNHGNPNSVLANFRLTKDINARSESDPQNYTNDKYPSEFAVLNNVSYFQADDGVHGLELWRSDATAAGTYLVKDVNPGEADGGREGNITVAGGKLYFPGVTDASSMEPWVSDGTEAGTFQLADINPGPFPSSPMQFVAVGNDVFFVANYNQLWKTDGTPQGTSLVKDLFLPWDYVGEIYQCTAVNGLLFFTAYDFFNGIQLWRSDGTQEGTHIVRLKNYISGDQVAPMQLTEYNNKLFFSADDGTGRRLWTSDGTTDGTGYAPGFNDVFMTADYLNVYTPTPFKIVNNILYLAGFTWQDGAGLYKFDASNDAGIVLVKDLTPGFETMFITPVDFAVVNERLYFKVISATGSFHDELWKSDGDAVSTSLIKTFLPGEITFDHNNGNGLLFFNVVHAVYGNELWKSDGTLQGTVLVKDIWPGNVSSAPYYLTEVNGKLLFNGADKNKGASLYISDGTSAGTKILKDINTTSTTGSGAGGAAPQDIGVLKDGVIFGAFEREFGNELYTSDGSKAGTFLVKDLITGEGSSYPNQFISRNGRNYFRANNTDMTLGFAGSTIYRTDGSTKGTKKLADINNGYFIDYDVTEKELLIYITYNLNSFSYELWRSDGTPAGTFVLHQGVNRNTYVVTVNNTAFFSAGDYEHGFELWKTDGSIGGTKLIKDINPGWEGSNPRGFFVHKKEVYFGATDGPYFTYGSFWKTDGSAKGTIKLKDVNLPSISTRNASNLFFCSSGKELYFMAFDLINPTIGAELFVTKGQPANTVLVKNINPIGYAYPNNMTDVNGTIYFLADDGENGMELWSSKGASKNTQLVKDISAGSEGSNLNDLHNINGTLYFFRDGGGPDAVLWSSDGTGENTQPVISNGLENLSSITNMEPAGDYLFLGAYTYKYGTEMFVADILKKAAPIFSRTPQLPVKSSTGFDPVVFPNPADQVSSVRIPVTVKKVTIRISDISGKTIWRKIAANTNAVSLPVETLPAGVYLVNITSGKECRILKLVKN